MKLFRISSIKNNLWHVHNGYSDFEVRVDDKGIGIYQIVDGGGFLIKAYRHQKVEVAFNFLIKKHLI